MKVTVTLILVLINVMSIIGQAGFNGGAGGGYALEEKTGIANFSYHGGASGGYIYEEKIGLANYSYRGGQSSGYDLTDKTGNANFSYRGGLGDGYNSKQKSGIANYSYRGGDDDGYSYVLSREPFVWTGEIGTSWNVPGNWNYNLIPGIFRPVIIPDGVPNWPFVNAGLLAIADTPNGSNYRCASLWIQENAFLQTRVNCRIENYGLIIIDGEMRVKKFTADAFKNFETGSIEISSTGLLNIKP